MAIYRKYISIRYKNLFDSFIGFRNFEIKVGRDLSLFPSLVRGDFEQEELNYLQRLNLNQGVNIWDVGANVGIYSIFFSKCFPNAKVVSFEPSKSTFELLEQNLAHNKCLGVASFNCGLGSSNNPKLLIRSILGAGSNSIVLKDASQENSSEQIQMTTIDAFLSDHPHLAPGFIKLDVEGYEPQVIMGGRSFIESQKPLIMMEVFPLLWPKDSFTDWEFCLDFLFSVYGNGLEMRGRKSQLIAGLDFRLEHEQRTLFFGVEMTS